MSAEQAALPLINALEARADLAGHMILSKADVRFSAAWVGAG